MARADGADLVEEGGGFGVLDKDHMVAAYRVDGFITGGEGINIGFVAMDDGEVASAQGYAVFGVGTGEDGFKVREFGFGLEDGELFFRHAEHSDAWLFLCAAFKNFQFGDEYRQLRDSFAIGGGAEGEQCLVANIFALAPFDMHQGFQGNFIHAGKHFFNGQFARDFDDGDLGWKLDGNMRGRGFGHQLFPRRTNSGDDGGNDGQTANAALALSGQDFALGFFEANHGIFQRMIDGFQGKLFGDGGEFFGRPANHITGLMAVFGITFGDICAAGKFGAEIVFSITLTIVIDAEDKITGDAAEVFAPFGFEIFPGERELGFDGIPVRAIGIGMFGQVIAMLSDKFIYFFEAHGIRGNFYRRLWLWPTGHGRRRRSSA